VSALLVLSLISSEGVALDGEAARYAGHANSLAAMLPPSSLRADVRFAVNAVRHMHTSMGRGVGWPPPVASVSEYRGQNWCLIVLIVPPKYPLKPGSDRLSRFIEVQPFDAAQFSRSFVDIAPERSVCCASYVVNCSCSQRISVTFPLQVAFVALVDGLLGYSIAG
jgi:hypothetical protein